MQVLDVLLLAICVVLAIPVLVLTVEVVAAAAGRFFPGDSASEQGSRGRVAVIVPAHNESIGMVPTLTDLRDQLGAGDRLVVVADNCSDDTAAVAAAHGAEVVTRDDPSRVGKGYALARGFEHLQPDPPDVVLVVDADCRVSAGSVDRLTIESARLQRPVQSLDLMVSPVAAGQGQRVAEFAWRLKNWARPLGLHALGLPCQLMGTGMAFPWGLVRGADLANGEIVEDLRLGLVLAGSGAAPVFCPSARVTSEFPLATDVALRQRMRWESGHTALITREAPGLLAKAIAKRNIHLLTLALDLIVPPLALLALLVFAGVFLSSLAWAFGMSTLPLMVSVASAVGLVAAILLTWLLFGRDVLTLRDFIRLPAYLARKVPLYGRIFSGAAPAGWVRTERGRPAP